VEYYRRAVQLLARQRVRPSKEKHKAEFFSCVELLSHAIDKILTLKNYATGKNLFVEMQSIDGADKQFLC